MRYLRSLAPLKAVALAKEFTQALVNQYGFAADLSIHAPSRKGDQRNHHAHIFCTTRVVTPEGFKEKTRALDDRKSGEVLRVREQWATMCNDALERAGHSSRVSHLSLEAQGINRVPAIAVGPAVTAMERRGIITEVGNLNREIANTNQELEELWKATL